ncbi:SKP1/BTB/POZ domain [Phytophthora cactorum]|nr:SKP1/BTB/POZ domain [Phytophthora cactorum]
MEPCYKRLHLQNVGRDGAVPDNTTVHTNSASGYLLSLVNNLILSDVEFVGMPKATVKPSSDRFLTRSFLLLQWKMRERHSKEIRIAGVSRVTFLLVLEYVYSDRFCVSDEAAAELFVAADKVRTLFIFLVGTNENTWCAIIILLAVMVMVQIGIESLKSLCEDKVCQSLTIETVARVFELSDRHHASKLKSECAAIITANFDAVSKTQGFQKLLQTDGQLALELMKQ